MTQSYESLAEYYAGEYLDKIFYFCLKKTGSPDRAEDLAQEISLCVLEELGKGTIPESFHGWVWQIARNRYARWADRRHRSMDASSGWDVSDLPEEQQPSGGSPEAALIDREERETLFRELAFTAAEYREILIAYYFEQRRIGEIASSLSISESAVKQRLHRARIKLKEGMNMARTFGKKSINPESIRYVKSGYQPQGMPDAQLSRKIPLNICIEAHNNPSTAEELAMELGVALPYIEEEIGILCDATLLKKTADGKYVTNFFIADKETQALTDRMALESAGAAAPALTELVKQMNEKLLAAGVKPDSMLEQDFLWLPAFECCRRVLGEIAPNVWTMFQRPYGGNWGVLGYEKGYSGMNGLWQNGTYYKAVRVEFWVHSAEEKGYFDLCQPDEWMGHTLVKDNNRCFPLIREVLEGKREVADFSESERRMWEEDMPRYVHEENGRTVFDLPVYKGNFDRLWGEELQNCPAYGKVKAVCVEYDRKLHDYLRTITDPNLHEQLDYVAAMLGVHFSTAMLIKLYEGGLVKEPANGGMTNATCYLKLD